MGLSGKVYVVMGPTSVGRYTEADTKAGTVHWALMGWWGWGAEMAGGKCRPASKFRFFSSMAGHLTVTWEVLLLSVGHMLRPAFIGHLVSAEDMSVNKDKNTRSHN